MKDTSTSTIKNSQSLKLKITYKLVPLPAGHLTPRGVLTGSREFDVLNLCCGGEIDKGGNLNLSCMFLGSMVAHWPAHTDYNTTVRTTAADFTLADIEGLKF